MRKWENGLVSHTLFLFDVIIFVFMFAVYRDVQSTEGDGARTASLGHRGRLETHVSNYFITPVACFRIEYRQIIR